MTSLGLMELNKNSTENFKIIRMLPPTYTDSFHDVESVKKMTYRRLGKTDLIVSKFGYGAAALGNMYNETITNESREALLFGLKSGINYIDTAPWYGEGLSEKRLGEILQNVPRSSYYLATKVGRYGADPNIILDFSAEKTKSSVEKSLELLGIAYIDLIQIHDVEFSNSLNQILNETIPTLLDLKAQGKVKYLGITGYNLNVLKKVVRLSKPNALDTALSYAKLTILNQELLDEIEFFESRNIGVINAAPTGMGLLTEFGIPNWHPALPNMKNVCVKAAIYCKERGFDLAQLAVAWTFHRPEVSTTLISSPNMKIMKMNLSLCFQRDLSTQEVEMIQELKFKFFDDLPIENWDLIEICKLLKNM